jgi:hypothetical protein
MEAIRMSLEGRIAIDVNFTDTSTAGGASSVKKISLVDTVPYTSGKVAVVTGTVGTSAVAISVTNLSYKNAAGGAVAFTSSVSRVAFAASGTNSWALSDATTGMKVVSSDGAVAVSRQSGNGSVSVEQFLLVAGTPTAYYTAVFYGS